jgi:hypothetical protein
VNITSTGSFIMSAFPMPPPGSSIAARVQAFLPVIEKANKDLEEKIAQDGAESVQIDSRLVPGAPEGDLGDAKDTSITGQASKAKGDRPKKKFPLIAEVGSEENLMKKHGGKKEENDGEDKEDEEEEQEDGGVEGDGQERQVQLEFALGDFDDTPLAKAEDEATLAVDDEGEEEEEGGGGREIVYKETEDE